MSRNTRALFHCDRIGWDSQESFVVVQASGWEEARMNDEALFGRLRTRVVAAVVAGASCRDAAQRFSIGVSSVVWWAQRFRRTGSVAAKPMGGERNTRL